MNERFGMPSKERVQKLVEAFEIQDRAAQRVREWVRQASIASGLTEF